MNHIKNRLILAAAILSSFAAVNVKGDIFSTCGVDLGAAGRTKTWAVFSLGQGSDKDDLSGGSMITGDVGVAGNGNINISGGTKVNGELYYRTPGKADISGGSTTGAIHHNASSDALLDQGVKDAISASNFAASLATSPAFASLTQINKSMSLTGSGCTVLNLQNFNLSGGATLTLTGTAGTAFIINVSNQFSLSGGSKIVLSGGIDPTSVLFNIKGTGSSVDISGGSSLQGIVMATKRKVTLSGGSNLVTGEVIGDSVTISGGSRVVQPVSPAQNR